MRPCLLLGVVAVAIVGFFNAVAAQYGVARYGCGSIWLWLDMALLDIPFR